MAYKLYARRIGVDKRLRPYNISTGFVTKQSQATTYYTLNELAVAITELHRKHLGIQFNFKEAK